MDPIIEMLRDENNAIEQLTAKREELKRRLEEHRSGKGAKYTRGRQPLTVVFLRETSDWSDALKEEARLKKLTKKQKEKLIAEFQAETAALTETVGV